MVSDSLIEFKSYRFKKTILNVSNSLVIFVFECRHQKIGDRTVKKTPNSRAAQELELHNT